MQAMDATAFASAFQTVAAHASAKTLKTRKELLPTSYWKKADVFVLNAVAVIPGSCR
jgi:hypothetical protein